MTPTTSGEAPGLADADDERAAVVGRRAVERVDARRGQAHVEAGQDAQGVLGVDGGVVGGAPRGDDDVARVGRLDRPRRWRPTSGAASSSSRAATSGCSRISSIRPTVSPPCRGPEDRAPGWPPAADPVIGLPAEERVGHGPHAGRHDGVAAEVRARAAGRQPGRRACAWPPSRSGCRSRGRPPRGAPARAATSAASVATIATPAPAAASRAPPRSRRSSGSAPTRTSIDLGVVAAHRLGQGERLVGRGIGRGEVARLRRDDRRCARPAPGAAAAGRPRRGRA